MRGCSSRARCSFGTSAGRVVLSHGEPAATYSTRRRWILAFGWGSPSSQRICAADYVSKPKRRCRGSGKGDLEARSVSGRPVPSFGKDGKWQSEIVVTVMSCVLSKETKGDVLRLPPIILLHLRCRCKRMNANPEFIATTFDVVHRFL